MNKPHIIMTPSQFSGILHMQHSEAEDITNLINYPELLEGKTEEQIRDVLHKNGFRENAPTTYGNTLRAHTTLYRAQLITADNKLILIEVDRGGSYKLTVHIQNTSDLNKKRIEFLQKYFGDEKISYVLLENGGLVSLYPMFGAIPTRISQYTVELLTPLLSADTAFRNPKSLQDHRNSLPALPEKQG